MSMEIWCRHFTGIQNDTCEAGVNYQSVRLETPGQMHRWPCTNTECRHLCDKFAPYTPEEIAEHERKLAAALSSLIDFEQRKREDCPHCGAYVDKLEQVGRCVYSRPCGCRLWQGRIPKEWKA